MLPFCLKSENSHHFFTSTTDEKGSSSVTNSCKECVVVSFLPFDLFKLYHRFITCRMTHLHFPTQAAASAEEHHVVSNGEVTGQSCTAPDYSGIGSVQTLVAKKHIVPPVFLHILWKEGRCVSTCSYITLCCRSGWGWRQQTMPQCFVCHGCT